MIELYDHQKTALSLLRINDGFALFMEQGTGKTFPVLFRLAELLEQSLIRNALIVAPKAVCGSWEDKIELLSETQQTLLKNNLTIMSYDKTWRRKLETFDCVVFDESHFIKTPTAKRTKACLKLASEAKYRFLLTGTPTSNGQLQNIWSQLCAVAPDKKSSERIYPKCFESKSYYQWLDKYAYLNKYYQPYKFKHVDEIQEIIRNHSFRITKNECLDLPDKLPDEILYVDFQDGKSTYKQFFKNSASVELDTVATNPLTRALKLRQICSGFVKLDDGSTKDFKCAKYEALKNFLSDFEKKLVIFCDFHKSIDGVSQVLTELKIRHVILDGRQKNPNVWREFQTDEKIQVIICQYKSGSAGIDLFAADTCLFFEPCLSSNLLEQAKDRIHRPGQKNVCSYYWLLTSGSIEFAIYNALLSYTDFGSALFEQYLQTYEKAGVTYKTSKR